MKISKTAWILLIFLFILAGFITWFKIVPLGRATYSISYPSRLSILGGKGFIGRFTPSDRVEILPGEPAKVTGDPVYFSVFTPRTFSRAKVTVTYQDNLSSSTPIIEAGVLVDNIVWRYRLAPLQNSFLDNGWKDWTVYRSGNILLFQKNKDFKDPESFLDALKNKSADLCGAANLESCLALYNADSLNDYFPKDRTFKVIPPFKPINIPMQGANQFYFIAKSGDKLAFDFDITDLNLNKDADPVIFSIYQGDKKIDSITINDNFGGEGSGRVTDSFIPISFGISKMPTAIYKLEVKADDDIVIKKISKAPSALNVIGHLHPVAAGDKRLSFWTDSRFIQVSTNNPASRQTISFGGKDFSLSEAYKQFEFSSDNLGLKEIKLTHDDVILGNDGTFSFRAEDFFNPGFKQVDRHFQMNNEIHYVLASYQSPTELENGWKRASAVLDTQEAYRERGKYSFMISIPGLSLENKGNILIKEVRVEFKGRTLWDKIKEFFGHENQSK